jgi:hypothetical protein
MAQKISSKNWKTDGRQEECPLKFPAAENDGHLSFSGAMDGGTVGPMNRWTTAGTR